MDKSLKQAMELLRESLFYINPMGSDIDRKINDFLNRSNEQENNAYGKMLKAAEILEERGLSPVLAKDKDGNNIYATEHEQIVFNIIAKALRGEE